MPQTRETPGIASPKVSSFLHLPRCQILPGGILVRLHGAVDAAGGVFGAAVLEVLEGFRVVVAVAGDDI
jgi:hypothetical protein